MKEPAKEAENQVFQYLEMGYDDDETIDDSPLHRSTPKDKKESFSFSTRQQLEQYFHVALAQQDEQMGTMFNTYGALMKKDTRTDSDKTLTTPRCNNWELESRLSALSSRSTALSEGCLDDCELPEQVIELIKDLATQLLQCEKEVVVLREENRKLIKQKAKEEVNERMEELTTEIDAWKESCDESRKEIENLKTSLSNHKELIRNLQHEKKQLSHSLSRLKINHGESEKDEQLVAQQTHISQNLNALIKLSEKQQQVISNLQESLLTEGLLNEPPKPKLDVSTSSGLSTLQSSLNASNGSMNLLAKKLIDRPQRMSSESTNLHYDESLVKLSRCVITSTEMLRHFEGRRSSCSITNSDQLNNDSN